MEKQTKAVGQTVGQATANYSDLIERLNELEKKVTDPAAKAAVKDIGEAAETSRAQLTTVDQAVTRSLATQQQVVAWIDSSAIANSGWMFLGKVNEDKNAWSVGSQQNVSLTPPPSIAGCKA